MTLAHFVINPNRIFASGLLRIKKDINSKIVCILYCSPINVFFAGYAQGHSLFFASPLTSCSSTEGLFRSFLLKYIWFSMFLQPEVVKPYTDGNADHLKVEQFEQAFRKVTMAWIRLYSR